MKTLGILSLLMKCFYLTTELSSNKLTWFGPRLCERSCQRTFGCSTFQYSTKYLSCKLQPDDGTGLAESFQNFTITKYIFDHETYATAKLRCPPSSKIFFNHRAILKCRGNTPILPSMSQLDRRPTFATLLIYEQYTTKSILEITLNDSNFHTIKSIQYKQGLLLESLLYLTSVKKFLMTNAFEGNLYMLDNLNGHNADQIDGSVTCMSMANDHIFYGKRPKRLMRMSQDGTNKVLLNNLTFLPLSMNVDAKRSIIYIRAKQSIHKVTFSGKVQKSVDVIMDAMCVGPDGDILYVSRLYSRAVYKLSFSNKKRKPVHKLGLASLISTLCVWGNNLFAVTKDCHMIVIGPNGSREIETDKYGNSGRQCFGSLKIHY